MTDIAHASLMLLWGALVVVMILYPRDSGWVGSGRLPRRRPWPFTQVWFSICSSHYHHDPACPRCQAGEWKNVVLGGIMHWIHDHAYPVWLRMVNWRMWLFHRKRWKQFQGR